MTETYDGLIWQQRSGALGAAIQRGTARIEAQARGARELAPLLRRLDEYQRELFEYFYRGFFPGATAVASTDQTLPQPDASFPPEYVLDQILSQAANDLNAIEQIADQRALSVQSANPTLEQIALAKADLLARQALEPAANLTRGARSMVVNQVLPVTYFQKMARIRVIPYAPVAMIGIPYTCSGAALGSTKPTATIRDFLAIPHEVAHYLYWHGTLDGKRTVRAQLLDTFRSQPRWQKRWVEELFADVYGCLIGGPAIALSFQDLQLSSDGQEFVEDDSEHPIPILRPWIYAKVIGAKFPAWVNIIEQRWSRILNEKRRTDGQVRLRGQAARGIEKLISPSAAIKSSPVDDMVQVMLGLLDGLAPTGLWEDYLSQSDQTDAKVYSSFEKAVDNLVINPALDIPLPIRDDSGNAPITPFDGLTQEERASEDQPEWLPKLLSRGWTTGIARGRDE